LAALAIDKQVEASDAEGLAELATTMRVRLAKSSACNGAGGSVLVNDEDMTDRLRTPAVDRTVSAVSAHPEVRRALIAVQRDIGRSGRVVMAGRDIGTVVIPDAEL